MKHIKPRPYPRDGLSKADLLMLTANLKESIDSQDAKIEAQAEEIESQTGVITRLTRTVESQAAEIQRLKDEIEALKRNQKRQAAPFSKGKGKGERKPSGRKKGQGNFDHKQNPDPAEVTDKVEAPVEETACPKCGGKLEEQGVEFAYETDIPETPKPKVTEYQIHVCKCSACGAEVRGRHPNVGKNQRGATAHRMGNRVMAAAHALHYGVGLPMRKVPEVMKELTGVRVTQGALQQDALRRSQGEVGQRYEELRQNVRRSKWVHTDDTGWRKNGKSAQLMVFETAHETVYQIRDQHRNEEVREVIPEDYDGVMITDRGRNYDAKSLEGVKQQKCIAHIQRSISGVLEKQPGASHSVGLKLKAQLRQAVDVWHDYHGEGQKDFAKETESLKKEITHHLRERSFRDANNQRLINEIGRHHRRGNLLRFLDDPCIEPTNNRAERALRPAVIARKVSHCSKNDQGARAFEAFKSVTQTIANAGHSIVNGLHDLFKSAQNSRAPP